MTHGRGDGIIGDSIHQSDFERSRGVNFFCGDEEFQRSGLPDQARQALRASPSGDEAECSAAMSEDGLGCGDPAVTGEREVETSAHAVAFDGGDDAGRIAGDCVHQCLSHGGELVGFGTGQCRDLMQVGADRKKLPIAGDDQRSRFLVYFVSQFVDGNGQCEHAGAGEAVGAFRRSEMENACRATGVDLEEARRHRNMMHYWAIGRRGSLRDRRQPVPALRLHSGSG